MRTSELEVDKAELARRLAGVGDPLPLLLGIFVETPVPLEILDAAGRSVAINPAHAALFGEGTLAGGAEALEPAEAPLRRALEGEIVRGPAQWRAPADGSRVALVSTYYPVSNERGVTHVVIAQSDVTAELAALERAEIERERLALLADAGDLFATAPGQQALDALPTLMLGRFADWCTLLLVDAETVQLRPVGLAEGPAPEARLATELLQRYPLALADLEGPAGSSGIGRSLLIRRLDGEALAKHARSEEHLRYLQGLKASSIVVSPLVARGASVGALIALRLGPEARPYDDGDLALVEGLAHRASALVERMCWQEESERARQKAERAVRHISRLQVLTAALSEAISSADVVRAILDAGAVATRADVVVLYAARKQGLELLGARGIDDGAVVRAADLSEVHPASVAMLRRWPTWVPATASEVVEFPLGADPSPREMGWAYVPMLLGKRLVGMLALGYRRSDASSLEEQAFFVTLAHQCVQAMERARLYEAERRSNVEAQQASRLKDEFLSVVSHELRTPLTAILGWAKILQTKPEKLAHGLAVIERNVRAQVRIIDDILDVSRVITGKLRLTLREVDLGLIVLAAGDILQPTAETRGVGFAVSVAPALPAVLGDADRLQQIAWNLLSNAIKFTPRGGSVRATVSATSEGVTLTVHDTGRGMTAELLPFIFDRFRQADSTSTREYGGLGLGLAIVSHLVELHGGAVRAESAGLGQGSRFTVVLPVYDNPDGATPTSRLQRVPRGIEGLRLLVVDDDPDTLDTLATLLANAGAEVRTASSAREALEVLSSYTPDVLVSDVALPKEDGFALLRQVRCRAGARHLPTIALTARAGVEDVQRCLDAGFDAHLAKPADAERLLVTIASVAYASQ
jgi:signal transduction histidine kinase